MADTADCILSAGKVFIGMDCQAKQFISRMNAVHAAFCDIQSKMQAESSAMDAVCPLPPPEPTPPPTPEPIPCPLHPEPTPPQGYVYLITVNDLDQLANDQLDALEDEVCALYELLQTVIDTEMCSATP